MRPLAVADGYSTNEDAGLTVTISGVLSNDTDADGNALTANLVTGPEHGSLTLKRNANGSFSYTPAANYNGPDSFTYKANDGSLDSNVATVSITVNAVNDAPVADGETYSTDEDTVLAEAVGNGVLVGDTDVDEDSLAAVLVDDVEHGSLTLNSERVVLAMLRTLNYDGPDSFTYRASDGDCDVRPGDGVDHGGAEEL